MPSISSYDPKWRMPAPSPQAKNINSNVYASVNKDVRPDAKRQSDELIQAAYSMRYMKQNIAGSGVPSVPNASGMPLSNSVAMSPAAKMSMYNGYANKTPEGRAPRGATPSPRFPLMQVGQPRPLKEVTAAHVGTRPSLVAYDGRPNLGPYRGSITHGLPASQQPRGYDPQREQLALREPNRDQREVHKDQRDPREMPSPQAPHVQNAQLAPSKEEYPPYFKRPSVDSKEYRDMAARVTTHHAENLIAQKPEPLSTVLQNEGSTGKDGKWNIIRIMHDLIENRIEDPTSEKSDDNHNLEGHKSPGPEDNSHIVNHVSGLPSGVRFHRSPESVPRAPFKGDGSHPDRTIPVANVNPILQSSNPLLHPKKQMLQQSRMETCRQQSCTPVKDNQDVTKSDATSPSPLKTEVNNTSIIQTPDCKTSDSKTSRKLHMVPIKERFKTKKMYNREQALQSIKSGCDGYKSKTKVPGRKPGRPKSVAPLMKKVAKAMKHEQLLGRFKGRGNDSAVTCDAETEVKPESKPGDSLFDFSCQDKDDIDGDDETSENSFSCGRKYLPKPLISKPKAKRGRPRTRPLVEKPGEKHSSDKEVRMQMYCSLLKSHKIAEAALLSKLKLFLVFHI